MEKNKQCPWCGADLKLQPGPLHKEGGNTFCNTTCAYEDRLSKQPINKQKQMGGIWTKNINDT